MPGNETPPVVPPTCVALSCSSSSISHLPNYAHVIDDGTIRGSSCPFVLKHDWNIQQQGFPRNMIPTRDYSCYHLSIVACASLSEDFTGRPVYRPCSHLTLWFHAELTSPGHKLFKPTLYVYTYHVAAGREC